MEVLLERIDNNYNFHGKGSSDIEVSIDGSEKIGGRNAGVRPMELVLMSLGSCAAMDIVSLLKKQRQKLDDLKIRIKGERDYDKIPAVFTKIHIDFMFYGDLDESKVTKASNLSLEKYCSVSAMLKNSVNITYSYHFNREG